MDYIDLLQQQIQAWQERRFTVVTGAITLVAVLCGFVLSDSRKSWTREQASTLVLIVLVCATAFAWYAGWQNAIIGAYLRNTLESNSTELGWETGIKMLNQRGDLSNYISLNKIIGFTFLTAALGMISVFRLHCESDPNPHARRMFFGIFAVFLLMLTVLTFPRILTPDYDRIWTELKIEHRLKQSPTTPQSP